MRSKAIPDADIAGIETDDGSRADHNPAGAAVRGVRSSARAPVRRHRFRRKTPFREHDAGAAARQRARSRSRRRSRTGSSCSSVIRGSRRLGIERRASRRGSIGSLSRSTPDKAKLAEDVLSGKLDYMSDSPPPDLLPTVRQRAGDRYEQTPDREHQLVLHEWLASRHSTIRACAQAVNYGVDKRGARTPLRRPAGRRAARSCRPGWRATTRSSTSAVARIGDPTRATGPRAGPHADPGGGCRGRQGNRVGLRPVAVTPRLRRPTPRCSTRSG